jgi:hypothetical protein
VNACGAFGARCLVQLIGEEGPRRGVVGDRAQTCSMLCIPAPKEPVAHCYAILTRNKDSHVYMLG